MMSLELRLAEICQMEKRLASTNESLTIYRTTGYGNRGFFNAWGVSWNSMIENRS